MTEAVTGKKGLVAPQTLKGFQDQLPERMIARNALVDTIRKVFEKYGFVPLDTPILEYLTTLIGTGGEETNKQMFRLESPEREAVAMRFDLTVPFARLIAQYPEQLKLPFRRYHIGPVFRADKPGPGRYRQFEQFDIDAAGCESVAVDAEIVAAMCEAMRAVGLANNAASQEFQVRINNRKLVDALLESCGISNVATEKHVLRVVDKLQKVGVDNIRKELGEGRIDESGDPIKGVGLPPDVIDKVLGFIALEAGSRGEVIEALARLLPDTDLSQAALQEMSDLAAALDGMGVAEIDVPFDPSLARGLDYYTGPVFEAVLPAAPQFGSVMGGGRYDHLVERFMDTTIYATGASIGLDRFQAALEHLGKCDTAATTTKVLVVTMRGMPVSELLKVASELRAADIPAEVFFGEPNTSMRNQLSLANARQIPVAVILGENELKNGQVAVKDLEAGLKKRADIKDHEEFRKAGKTAQRTVARSELVQTVRELLG